MIIPKKFIAFVESFNCETNENNSHKEKWQKYHTTNVFNTYINPNYILYTMNI